MKLILALVLALSFAAPTLAAEPADLAITSSQPGTVPARTEFTHTYTVTNLGGTAGNAQTTDAFSTDLIVVAVSDPRCFVYTVLVRSRRQQAGVQCNLGSVAPGESVTVTETLQTKYLGWSGSVMVNRNHNVALESTYANNAAFWAVVVP